MKLIETVKTGLLSLDAPNYVMDELSAWHDNYYYLPQPRYLLRISYATDKNDPR